MSSKGSGLGDLLATPKGGGAVKGMGETFSADPHTGSGSFAVPIATPAGRNGLTPELKLSFSAGGGDGPFGLGWSLSLPGVSRLTSKGIPRYQGEDLFVISGAEELVPVEQGQGFTRYRPRTEGLFATISHIETAQTTHWEVVTKDGLTSI
jgi:hypothetical protein